MSNLRPRDLLSSFPPAIRPVLPWALLGLIALALILPVPLPSDAAARGPSPPCAAVPRPPYPALGAPEGSGIWTHGDLGDSWSPPECTGWTGTDFRLLVALTGHIGDGLSADQLLSRFGAVSSLAGLRYWSATESRWRELVTSATAVRGSSDKQPRSDFSPQELRRGATVYFLQSDNRSAGSVLYR